MKLGKGGDYREKNMKAVDPKSLNVNDWIHVSEDEAQEFLDFTKRASVQIGDYRAVPGDILLSRTIPLRDLMLEISGNIFRFNFPDGDFDGNMENWPEVWAVLLGRITHFGRHYTLSTDCIVKKGSVGIACDERFLRNGVKETAEDIERLSEKDRDIHDTYFKNFHAMLAIWNGIQIAMLNPYVKNVFRTETIRKTGFNPNGKKRKSIVKYIRHHYLNPGALSPKTEAGQMLRKTMAWYVCGHWRHYQDGKTIFIQPYWKGPLRETKVCEPRERVIV